MHGVATCDDMDTKRHCYNPRFGVLKNMVLLIHVKKLERERNEVSLHTTDYTQYSGL